jgi:anti-sigma B factor antagonist
LHGHDICGHAGLPPQEIAVFPGIPEEKIMALEIKEKELQGIIILELAGRLVLGQESMDFRGKVKEVLEKSDWVKEKWGWETRIVLDLGKVSFVDSAGLGALIAARTSTVSRGAKIKLACLTKKMRNVLSISKVVTVFDCYDSVEAAVNSYPKAEPTADVAPTPS